jgi:hypothetical protein
LADFNVDLLKYDIDKDATKFLDLFLNFDFLPIISIPTRITKTTSTLLDHIFFRQSTKGRKITNDQLIAGCLMSGISDHLPIFIVLPLHNAPSIISKNRPLVHLMSESNKKKFRDSLQDSTSSLSFTGDNSINDLYDNLIDLINSAYNNSFPLIQVSRKRSKDKCWVNQAIIKSCNKKSQLYKKWIRTKNLIDFGTYKDFASAHAKLIKKTKSDFYKTLFESCKRNTMQLWKEINKSISLNQGKKSIPTTIKELLINDQKCSDPTIIAEELNNYFSTMGKKLAEQLPMPTMYENFKSYLPPSLPNSFAFIPFTYTEIDNMIVKLKNRKSAGADNFKAKFVYNFRDVLIAPLCHLFNYSVDSGIFPTALKLAKTIPIPKTKNNLNLQSNYRPISLLSIFSKIFESLISIE